MISAEPVIHVGILERQPSVEGVLRDECTLGEKRFHGPFRVEKSGSGIRFTGGGETVEGSDLLLRPAGEQGIEIHNVKIGIQFHWERSETQVFRGAIRFVEDGPGLTVINEVGLEEYLSSVISSEMSATSPMELLKAHAITSRSWLVAILNRSSAGTGAPPVPLTPEVEGEVIRWYDREEHAMFDVCADDHCQRYQGITKISSGSARAAVEATRGVFLVYEDAVCDARYSKSCGGISEGYEHVWDHRPVPYLQSISDAETDFGRVRTEGQAERWITSRPAAYCNTTDAEILRQVLPSFDQETTDFFRWTVTYSQKELRELLRRKSGLEFGDVLDLQPLDRGRSGRIVRLKIVGSGRTVVVGKELEIRRWLSPTHLYSSAFVAGKEGTGKTPERFVLRGAGWGHGVGLCQIGAAVMATQKKTAEQILLHYFRGAELRKLY